MKPLKQLFLIPLAAAIFDSIAAPCLHAAERTVQLNIPGCGS